MEAKRVRKTARLPHFKDWFGWVTRSRLKPLIKVAQLLKRHLDNLLTYLEHRITNAVTEGLNSKIQSLKSAPRGFGISPTTESASSSSAESLIFTHYNPRRTVGCMGRVKLQGLAVLGCEIPEIGYRFLSAKTKWTAR